MSVQVYLLGVYLFAWFIYGGERGSVRIGLRQMGRANRERVYFHRKFSDKDLLSNITGYIFTYCLRNTY